MKALTATLALLALAGVPAHAAEHQCIPVHSIKQTPAIDDKTVLIELQGRNRYMRMDLAERCPDLKFNGFIHDAHADQLCTSDPLRMIEPVGAVCMISRIVDITPEEAHELLHRKK